MNFIDPSNYKPLWHIVAAYIGPVLLKPPPSPYNDETDMDMPP